MVILFAVLSLSSNDFCRRCKDETAEQSCRSRHHFYYYTLIFFMCIYIITDIIFVTYCNMVPHFCSIIIKSSSTLSWKLHLDPEIVAPGMKRAGIEK